MRPDNPQTLLVVDNDPELVKALSIRLTHAGYRCLVAGTGTQAIAEFARERIDLVISDLDMPCGDGVALGESIRRVSPVPLIFITGFKDSFKRRLRNVSNATVLRKPFDSDELLGLVECALSQSAATGPNLLP